jgi:hypothetical protein
VVIRKKELEEEESPAPLSNSSSPNRNLSRVDWGKELARERKRENKRENNRDASLSEGYFFYTL